MRASVLTFCLLLGCRTAKAPHSVTLRWQPSNGNAQYNVYRLEKGQPVQLNHQPIPCCTFVDMNVLAGHQYKYQVTSLVNGKESPPSPPIDTRIPK